MERLVVMAQVIVLPGNALAVPLVPPGSPGAVQR